MKETVNGEALIQALPYIQEFRGRTVVVKYGGNAMISGELKESVIRDLILMACVGIRTVLVHGGGPEIEAMLRRVGKESRFVRGLRYTDEETMEIVLMTLCGKINKDIVTLIQRAGGRAVGLCGIDGGLLRARRTRSEGEDLGLVGEIESVDPSLIHTVLESGAIPVISSVGLGEDEGRALNINADIAAAKIAGALKAEKLLLMTDVQGILRDVKDPTSLIKEINLDDLAVLKVEGAVSGGMIPKTDCCVLALEEGVRTAHILDGRLPHALLEELFTPGGIGTMITA